MIAATIIIMILYVIIGILVTYTMDDMTNRIRHHEQLVCMVLWPLVSIALPMMWAWELVQKVIAIIRGRYKAYKNRDPLTHWRNV